MDGKLRNMTSIYLRYGDEILFLYRIGSRVVNQKYVGSAGGHFEREELNDAKACVLREMNEELGLNENSVKNLDMRYITLRLKNGEIRQNYYFFADLLYKDIKLDSNEGKLQWVKLEDIPSLEMPCSAKYVIEHYLSEGRHTDKLYGGITTATGTTFVELQEF